MALGPFRPRFRMVVPGPVDAQIDRLQAAVTDRRDRFVSRVLGHHVDITVVPEDRHRWSPYVQLEFRQEDGETVVDGLVGPSPNVWTFFAFMNGSAALTACFGGMLGLSQLMLGQHPWGMWTVLGGAVVLVIMYFASQAGRGFAAEQSRALKDLVEAALGVPAT